MSAFTSPLVVEYLDGHNWRLTEEFDFASEILERIVRVPVGFVTDFASIPRALWTLLPPTGRYGKAAVIHDCLYQFPEAVDPPVNRGQADRTLREGMEALDVNRVVRWIVYSGVRVGGWVPWRRYRAGVN